MNCVTKKKLGFILGITTLLFMAAHGFRMFNNMYSGDALVDVYQADYAWEISLGRCFNPIWVFIRGTILSPWFLSLLAIVWLSLSVFFISDLFKIEDYLSLGIMSGVLGVNVIITSLMASYLPWIDLYTFAIFLNVFGVWLFRKKKIWAYAVGVLCITLSLGTYQAYVMIGVSLVMMLTFIGLLEEEKIGKTVKEVLVNALMFLISGGLYYLSWKLIQAVFGVWTANTYNGLSSLGNYEDTSVISLVFGAYRRFFEFFLKPDAFVSLYYKNQSLSIIWQVLIAAFNVLLILFVAGMLIYNGIKKKAGALKIVLLTIGLLIFPLGCNIVYVLSKGMEHTLMVYSFLFVYIFAVILAFSIDREVKVKKILKWAVSVALIVICWSNMVFSNQIYSRRGVEEQATLSLITRVVGEIENTEGYKPGETKVAIVGTFENSPVIKVPDGLSDLSVLGMGSTAAFYEGTEMAYIKNCLHANMVFEGIDRNQEEIAAMPAYPEKGSIEFVGDVLVVKIGNY